MLFVAVEIVLRLSRTASISPINLMFFDPKQFLKNPVKRHRQSPRSSNQMNDIATYLEKLDLSSYVTVFVSNGFDTWEDVLDITESDLDYMGVKIGHRRRLQREIANYKGVSFESIISRTDRAPSVELGQPGDGENRQGRFEGQSSTGKRRYRRHPKPDKNAPERPPSAYVLFSNQVREELKPQNLSFTEIAKVVGERWQQLDTTGREPFETQAAVMKDEFNSKMAEYKRTDSWKEYQEYLQAFKASQTQSISSSGEGGKRLKLERSGEGSHASSRGSVGTPTSTHGSPVSHSSGNMHLSMPEAVSSTISSPVSTSGFPAAYTHQMLVARTGGTPPGRGPTIYPPSDVVSTAGSQHSGSSSLQNEPSRMLPRRSNNPAAPFLQPQRDSNDTSTGSMSSLQSSTSQASGSYTPVTPIDNTIVASRPADGEHTPTYTQQSFHRLSIGSTGSQPHVSPPASKMPPTGYSLPLPYSSVTTVNHDPASRILPPPQQPGGFQSTFSRGSLPPPIQPPPPSSTRQSPPHGNRMDGMSILALAGSMVDGGDPADKKPQSS